MNCVLDTIGNTSQREQTFCRVVECMVTLERHEQRYMHSANESNFHPVSSRVSTSNLSL